MNPPNSGRSLCACAPPLARRISPSRGRLGQNGRRKWPHGIYALLTLLTLLNPFLPAYGASFPQEANTHRLSPLTPLDRVVSVGPEQPVQLSSNSFVLLGSPSIFSIIAEPEFVFFQLDVGDGSDLLFSEEPGVPFSYVYESAGTYEYQLSAFGESEEPFIVTGIHTVSEFVTSPWPEPKLNFDFGGEMACDVCPTEQYAILDPVYLHNGEFFLQEEDLRIPGRGFDFVFQRTYKSQMLYDGRLGHNWLHNYAQYLVANGTGIDHVSGGGRRDSYSSSDGESFTSPAGYYTQLTRNADNTFTIREAQGSLAVFNALDGSAAQGRIAKFSDRNGNSMHFEYDVGGRLARVFDTMGRPVDYVYNPEGRLGYIEDFTGRRVSFGYDANGDLVAVTGPAVTGTPNGNDFPNGKTWQYTYSGGQADERLNHNLLSIIAPNEVADGSLTPFLINTYAHTVDPNGYEFDRIVSQVWGGTNATGVPAGGTFAVSYEALNRNGDPSDLALVRNRTTVIDRNGNKKVYEHNINGHRLRLKEFSNRDIRPSDPEFWETTFSYNGDGQLLRTTNPAGNSARTVFDDANPDRLRQGNRLAEIRRADSIRGGDQTFITTTWTYEPIYNQVRSVTEPRGNDPTYAPQNGGSTSPERYTTRHTFDYEEACDFALIGARTGRTELDVQQMLAASGMCAAPPGDLNDDGTTQQVAGNVIVTRHPTVNLVPNAKMVAIEGGTQQPIVERTTYNHFGQILTMQDPEGNIDSHAYYSEQDPNGDGVIDNAGGDPDTGGYLRQTMRDTVSSPERNSATDPAPANIRTLFTYDAVGNITREIDGRGIATDYFVNELNQVVQSTRAAAHDLMIPSPAEPVTLIDFQYLERLFYDANNNLILRQMEDRGNTSQVDGNLPNSDLHATVSDPDPMGGTAYVDTLYQYDILDNRVEKVEEVLNSSEGTTFLRSYTRYDANQNAVLEIYAEGNAVSSIYDERDLLFQQTRGAISPPAGALMAVTDPLDYNVRGGTPSTTSRHYDLNRNLIESVDAADTDGSSANNSDISGNGDRTRMIYDGFDRLTSSIDSVGNQTVIQYDPASNAVRQLSFGPVDGPSPTSDGSDLLAFPVSANGVIQPGNLLTDSLLAATEKRFDELSRHMQTDRVLFVNTTPTVRTPDIAAGASDIGKADLTPNDAESIPDLNDIAILGRVSTRTEYDRNSRSIFMVEDDGDSTLAVYDGADRLIKRIDAEGNIAELAYDDNNNMIETRETDVAQKSGVAEELFLTTNFYDSLNRLQRSVNNLGQTVDYRYDSRNNLVAAADAQGPLTGESISRRVFAEGPNTANQINGFGNLKLMAYDGINRKTREERILTASGEGDGTNIGADLFGIRIAVPALDTNQGGGDGLISVHFAYDGNSLLTSLTDDNGNQTQYNYDNLNRKVSETKGVCVPPALAESCDAPTTITYEHDPDDNLARVIDENGSVIDYIYDAINRRVGTNVDRGRGVVGTTRESYAYDGLSRLTRASDNNEPENSEDDSTLAYAYDSLSRLLEETQQIGDQDPRIISIGWRAGNLRTTLTYPSERSLVYRYDAVDRLRTIADGRPQQPAENAIFLPLVGDGIRSSLRQQVVAAAQVPPGTATIPLTDPIAQYTYIGQGRVLERMYANGTRMSFLDNDGTTDVGFDGLRRPVRLRHLRNDGSLIVGFMYSYDRMDNKLSEEKLHAATESEIYRYDSVYRLVQFRRGELNASKDGITSSSSNAPLHSDWALDGVGNWQQVDDETRQHSSFNELTARNDGDFVPLLYDDNGNQSDDGTLTFSWDYRNRLRDVSRKDDGTLFARYAYDVQGRRISKRVVDADGQEAATHFFYSGWQVLEERDGTDTLLRQYVYGGRYIDEVIAMDRNLNGDEDASGAGDTRLYYHQNTLQSVFALTNLNSDIIEGYHYDAYGRQTVITPGPDSKVDFGADDVISMATASTFDNPYLFTGRRLDAESGLYHYRSRYLNTQQGRFISRDPIGIWGDRINLGNGYAYVGLNPTGRLDPMGEKLWTGTEKVDWSMWQSGGWHFGGKYGVGFHSGSNYYTGYSGVRISVQSQSCCHLKWNSPADISRTSYRLKLSGYLFSRDNSWNANAGVEIVAGECPCRDEHGRQRNADGFKVTIGHQYSTDETAKVSVNASAKLTAKDVAEAGVGVQVEFAPSSESSWIKTYKIICPTGGANAKPSVRDLNPPFDESTHSYHKRGDVSWSGLSASN